MTEPFFTACRRARPFAEQIGAFLAWTVLFALSTTQAPPYYSNQNQYLLHGLAAAGDGNLGDDWLANTLSPTPVFDALVAVTARHLGEGLFPVYYALLQGAYFVSVLGIAAHVAGDRLTPRTRRLVAALLFLAHAAVLRWTSFQVFGWDYPCYVQGWLAAQYVLGPVFQPSVFGVFLVVALHQFLRDRPVVAVTSAAVAVTLHPTYALSAGLIVLGFSATLQGEGRTRHAVVCGVLFAVLVLPTVVYVESTFLSTNAETAHAVQNLLVNVRIPHHAIPAVWFDGVTAVQLVAISVGVALTRGTRLFPVVRILALGSLLLTVVQIGAGNDTLALMFPWRASVILIPVATAVVLTRLVTLAGRRLDGRATVSVSIGIIAACVASGAGLMLTRQGYAAGPNEVGLLDYVRTHKRPGDVYLLPVEVPKPPQRWSGSLSSDFKPAAAPRLVGRVIPADLQRFRLVTRAAIFVDFKAIPYKDVEVLEWHRRLLWNQTAYASRDWDRAGTVREAFAEGVTHVVATADRDVSSAGLVLEYADDAFKLYRVRRGLPEDRGPDGPAGGTIGP
jgi:hypothetical protein